VVSKLNAWLDNKPNHSGKGIRQSGLLKKLAMYFDCFPHGYRGGRREFTEFVIRAARRRHFCTYCIKWHELGLFARCAFGHFGQLNGP
jgi:hypothetical protein